MEKEKPNRQTKSSKEGYIIMPNNFLAEWIRLIGKGPVLLYIQLLTYCHKEKDIVWPALSTLGDCLDMSKNSLISYQKTLLKYGLIKKTAGRRSAQGNYRSNLYKVTPIKSPKNGPGQVQKLDTGSPKIVLDQVQNLHPNNNNLNITNTTTTKREKDAVVAVVNFKKLKEKGDLSACNAQAEEKMQASHNSKEHYTGQAIRERMVELDFKEEFIEKMLKEYSEKKIEEKLDLLMGKRNIQSPAGWLMAALKNDYQDGEQEDIPIQDSSIPEGKDSIHRARNKETGRINPSPTKNINTPEQVSREKALEAIKLIQDNLSACMSPRPSGKRTRARENVGVGFIRPVIPVGQASRLSISYPLSPVKEEG